MAEPLPRLAESVSLQERFEQLDKFRFQSSTAHDFGEGSPEATLVNRDNLRDLMAFRYLPKTWVEREAANWREDKTDGVARPVMQYENGGDRTISFEMLLDHTIDVADVPRKGSLFQVVSFLQRATRPLAQRVFQEDDAPDKAPPEAILVTQAEFDAQADQLRAQLEFGRRQMGVAGQPFVRPRSDDETIRRILEPIAAVPRPAGRELYDRFAPKRLLLIRADRPNYFSCYISKLSATEVMFRDQRPMRTIVSIELVELLESRADVAASGHQLPPVELINAEVEHLNKLFEEGRLAVTESLGLEGLITKRSNQGAQKAKKSK